jgi:acetylornithine deacetylase/succinyl-diaminopimelate desuccinylase-like protein
LRRPATPESIAAIQGNIMTSFRLVAAALVAAGLATPMKAEPAGWPAFRAMFQEMVETDSSYATGDCTALVEKTAARMKAAGFPAENLHLFVPDGAPKAGNLVAVLPGKDLKAKAVLMLGHIDVVNARREDWTRDPFVLVEENGEFYGRGVSDMKAQDAIWANNMVRYHAEGYRPRRSIKMALTCGEETGGFVNGAAWLAQNQRELIDAGVSLTEGGGGDLDDQGRKLAVTVMAAEKLTANFTLEVTGPGGHSSKPRPENPIVILGHALTRLDALPFPTQFNDFSRAYFAALAPRVDAETGAAMQRMLAEPQDQAANAIVNRSVSRRAMLRTTCIPTLIEGGHAPNAQPQRVRATVNCRLLPGQSLAAVEATIKAAVNDPRVKVITPPPTAPRPPSPPLTPQLMDPIRAVAAKVFPGVPVTPMQETFGTDSSRLTAVGIPTIGFSGLFRGDDAGNIHGLNEHISVQSVTEGREFLYRLIKAYAEQK